MRRIWCHGISWYTYIRIESASKLIIVSDTVQRRCKNPGRFNSDGLSIGPVRRLEGVTKGGTGVRKDPSARGQFPEFGTVGKMALPPTETRAKTLKRVAGFYCSLHPTKAGG